MKAIALFFALLLAGCSSMPDQMQGTFTGTKPDFVVVKRDGAVYWSPMSKTDDKLVFVGIAAPKKDQLEVPLVVPSSSTFLDSKLTYSSDFRMLSFDWGQDIRGQGKLRSTDYRKNQK
jgi:hypothetical protein